LPRTPVQIGYLLQEPQAIAVLEVEEPVEIPVQVVRQVQDLPP